jgi:hypothetical protein
MRLNKRRGQGRNERQAVITTPGKKRETWGTGHTEWKYPDAIVMRQRNAGVLRLRSG